MEPEMGYRNMLAVEELCKQGKLTVTPQGRTKPTSPNTRC